MEKQNNKKSRFVPRLVAVCAVLLLLAAIPTTAYAANIGGFRHNANIWLYGETTNVTIEQVGDGRFVVTYPDGHQIGTGGIQVDLFGNETGVSYDDILDEINNSAELVFDENGSIWFYYHDHKVDIADMLDENNTARLKFKDGVFPTYFVVTVYEDGGYSVNMSHTGYDG